VEAALGFLETLFSAGGKTALVTGGASGIGRMCAEALVQAGARVMIASRKGEVCGAVAAELNALGAPGSAEGFVGDVASEQGIAALVKAVGARTDKLHILVNNAGRSWGEPLETFPFSAWEKVMTLNVAGMFTLTRDLLPLLEKTGTADDPARVVNLGSVMGTAPLGDGAYSYAASKAAVHHMTKILAKELAGRHVTLNAFAPGPFRSRMTAFATADEARRARVAETIPLGRIGRPEDIAGALLYLCGRGGAYITGAVLPIDGGVSVQTGHELFPEE
jgi:NAD(P)-dependent dehydrogenase (short-subunit alcohol dehydrogenase family)